MKNKILWTFIITLAISSPVKADYFPGMDVFESPDVFYTPAQGEQSLNPAMQQSDGLGFSKKNKTIPPIKLLRMKIQEHKLQKAVQKNEYAPTGVEPYRGEVATSDYASKEEVEDFEDMTAESFDSEEQTTENTKKKSSGKKQKAASKPSEEIILDCDNVDYDAPNYLIYAKGNVNVNFVKQGTSVKADLITFDRANNTIKAEGNVKIIKNGQVTTGDYIFVDLNEENAFIENPVTLTNSIEIHSKKGYVYGDKIVQEDGKMTINKSFPIFKCNGVRSPRLSQMLMPKHEETEEYIKNNTMKLKARAIKYKQKGDLEVLSIKRGHVYKGDKKVFYIPAVKIYSNKNHDYVETNFWEFGYYRGLGSFTGPGWVFELPKGSVLKTVPFFNYYNGAGVGLYGRFNSGTNMTTAAYGSAAKRLFVLGRQDLDDNLYLQYSMNSYMDEWFLGRRRPKYGVGLVYVNGAGSNGFLIPGQNSSFRHRFDVGYYHDLDFDKKFERVKSGGNIGTTRFRYMAQAVQSLYNYKNEDKLSRVNLSLVGQASTALYGTGDTQAMIMGGPILTTQYRRWMQMIGYYFAASEDHSPMKRYDAYRYGSQFVILRETLRVFNWLALSWHANISTSNDTINGKRLAENAFYISLGPDYFKVHTGYDFVRQILRINFELMLDAKGSEVEYKTFELTQDKKKKEKKDVQPVAQNPNLAPTQPQVLQRAVVENVKVMEDVL